MTAPTLSLTSAEVFRRFKFATMRARSNALEAGYASARLQPWLFGPRCALFAVERIEARGDGPTSTEIMNLLWIAEQEPAIGACAVAYGGLPAVAGYLGKE